jgi:hypothetical protein
VVPDPVTGEGLCSACAAEIIEQHLSEMAHVRSTAALQMQQIGGAIVLTPGQPSFQITEIEFEDFTLRHGFPVRAGMKARVAPGANIDTAWQSLREMVARKLNDDMDILEARKLELAQEIEQLQIRRDQISTEVTLLSQGLAALRVVARPADPKPIDHNGADGGHASGTILVTGIETPAASGGAPA